MNTQVPEPAPKNMLPYSQDFSRWAKDKPEVILSANTNIAPDGTRTAHTLTSFGAAGIVSNSITNLARNTNYTFSVYVKKPLLNSCSSMGYIQYNFAGGGNNANGGVRFNFITMSTQTYWGNITDQAIQNIGSGWY